MESNTPIKKLFKMALYTSTAIGVLIFEPLYITLLSTMPDILKVMPFNSVYLLFLLSVCGGTIVVFIIWSFNILITYLINKYNTINISGPAKYMISYLLCLIFFVGMRMIIQIFIKVPVNTDLIQKTNNISFDLARVLFIGSINTIILIIQDLVLLREKKAMIELENTQLKLKNVEAANQQLKLQIHPHFLFNALNTLKTLIKKQPLIAEDYLVKLSSFLRAAISLDNVNTVKLGDELKQCLNYMDMQKMRFGEALQFSIDVQEEIKDAGLVPVFAIQLLLENAIKHNAFTHEAPLSIKIEYKDGRVIVSNNIKQKITTEISTGIGLTNLAERYRILSGDEIRINETGNIFSVSIKILSDDDSNHRR